MHYETLGEGDETKTRTLWLVHSLLLGVHEKSRIITMVARFFSSLIKKKKGKFGFPLKNA